MRWLSRDPIGYEGGDNLYEYVDSNPVKFNDPDGLAGEEILNLPEVLPQIKIPGPGGVLVPVVVAGGAVAGGFSIYCYFYPDECEVVVREICGLPQVDPNVYSSEHKKGKRGSTTGKHEEGQARKKRDQGGEKGDANRRPGLQRPENHKGPWPPKHPKTDPNIGEL